MANPIGFSRRDVVDVNKEGRDALSTDTLSSPPQVCLSLWELLLVQSHGDAERQELLAAYRAVESSVGLPPLAQNLFISKTLNIRKFLLNSCIRRAALDEASVNVGPVVLTRMKVARRFTERHRAKFLRWEFVKSCMMHGMHVNGVLTDEQGEGSAVSLPLRCTKEPLVLLSGSEADAGCQAIFKQKMELLFCNDALHLYDTLFRHMTQRGGMITRPVYFAVMLLFVKATLVHLPDEDIHKLIAADFEVDCAETLSLMQRMRSSDPKRRASVRNLLAAVRSNSVTGTDGTLDINTCEMMDARVFQRFCGSLAFVWLEGTNFSELSLFMSSFSQLLLPKTEYFDLDFCQKYSQATYLPPARSLIPNVDGITSERLLDVILRYETVKSIFIRFPMYTSAHEEVLKQHTQRAEQALLTAFSSPASTTKRRKKSLMGHDGFVFGLRPHEESARVAQEDDTSSFRGTKSRHLDKSMVTIGTTRRPSESSDRSEPNTMGDSFTTDFLMKVTEAVLETPRQSLRKVVGAVGLDVPQKSRHATDAPTLRQVQYMAYRNAPRHYSTANIDMFSSRLDASTISTSHDLPSVMQHHYRGATKNKYEDKRRVAHNVFMERLNETVRAEANASMNAPSRLLPEIRRPRIVDSNRTRAASSLLTYDLGLNQLIASYDRSKTPW